MSDKYLLAADGRTAVPAKDVLAWGRWFEKAGSERVVAKTKIGTEAEVSTVFLGLDHSFGQGPPLIFETLVFGGPMDGEMDRYSTWDEAERGHADMVFRANAAHAASFPAAAPREGHRE